jgi:Sec-independent protein secretion pathway component TatC
MAARRAKDPDAYVMSFGDHIEELRRHLILALVGGGVALLVMLWYSKTVVAFIYAPLYATQRALHLPPHTFSQSTIGPLTLYLGVAFKGALILSGPWILYQAWLFISAGLYETERRAATFLVGLSVLMTSMALALTYYVFLPATVVFLLMFSTSFPIPETSQKSPMGMLIRAMVEMNKSTLLPGATGVSSQPAETQAGAGTQGAAAAPAGAMVLPIVDRDPANPVEGQIWFNRDLNEIHIFQDNRVLMLSPTTPSMVVPLIDPKVYLDEVTMLALGVVAVFHVPVVMCVLGMTGLINPATLKKRRKIVIFGCFVASLFLTPSQDLFSNIALPLMAWALFEFGLVLMSWFYRKRQRRIQEEEMAEAGG